MEITLTTPALFFPAISLLLLAYTNRFLALGARVRELHARVQDCGDQGIRLQIRSLRRRIVMIRNMQLCGATSMLCCVLCMFLLFAGFQTMGKIVLALSMILLIISLVVSLLELRISVEALNIQLSDCDSAN